MKETIFIYLCFNFNWKFEEDKKCSIKFDNCTILYKLHIEIIAVAPQRNLCMNKQKY